VLLEGLVVERLEDFSFFEGREGRVLMVGE